MNLSMADLAYLAGFFDGEGNVSIVECKPRTRNSTASFSIRALLTNTDPRNLLTLQAAFGGTVKQLRQNERHLARGHRPVFVWNVAARKAQAFFEAIRPFVRMKAEQIDIALAVQATMRHRRALGFRGGRPQTDDELHFRRQAKQRISDLNRGRIA